MNECLENDDDDEEAHSRSPSCFFTTPCISDKDTEVQAGKLYKAYMEWCKENGHKPINGTRFGKAIKNLEGIKCQRKSRMVMYRGLKLDDEWDVKAL